MTKSKRFALLQCAMTCAAMVLAACAGNDGQTPTGAEGEMQVSVEGLSAWQIESMVINAQPANVNQALAYQADSGTFTGTLVLPVGTQTLTANGYAQVPPDAGAPDAGTTPGSDGGGSTLALVARGTATVNIVADTTAAVAMNIFDLTPSKPQPDIGPIIYSSTSSSTRVDVNRPIEVAVAAYDLDGDPLSYAWTSNCPAGVFTAPASSYTMWYSSQPGSCTLTVTVTSKQLSTSKSLNVTVNGVPGTGGAQVTGTYFPRPEVYAISAFHPNYLPLTTISRSASSGNLPQVRSGVTYTVEVFVDFGTPLGANRTVDLTASCGTVQRTNDACAGPVRTSNCSVQFSWASPFAGSACKLTGSASNESLTDGFSIGIPLL